MSLTIYHLHWGQSDRIVWLCEELAELIPNFTYSLVIFPRGLPDSEGKKNLFSLHPSGTAPTMVDESTTPPIIMTESQAILEYIINVHGQGHFQITPSAGPHTYSQYLYWLCFANGSFQAFLSANLLGESLINQPGASIDPSQNWAYLHYSARTPNHLNQYNNRLAESKYLAGEEFSAADMMSIYAFTLYRAVHSIDLTDYPHILRWLGDVTSRPAYRRALEKCEDGLPPLIQAKVPKVPLPVLMSVESWKVVPEWSGKA
ncbi:uncharacterized protein Z518_03354 [Rhinocladiella mackenziei CBS 650.93]|uniref:Glutathione S-transferase n=1 Tax=Rhinocladiella mackenziei CBS 650.93 TaxID=1442369 RepID=A0A0D2G2D5_9EURO|nr:uncharacterized protein Z518_03354 [Rhinocladiella mackenziei CBS 650.93]KIX08697.1 hypothetical protein Z518_03354 [Rhinocladiella mackenziei CBS 650.93]